MSGEKTVDGHVLLAAVVVTALPDILPAMQALFPFFRKWLFGGLIIFSYPLSVDSMNQ
jgi:hypothetical protein